MLCMSATETFTHEHRSQNNKCATYLLVFSLLVVCVCTLSHVYTHTHTRCFAALFFRGPPPTPHLLFCLVLFCLFGWFLLLLVVFCFCFCLFVFFLVSVVVVSLFVLLCVFVD